MRPNGLATTGASMGRRSQSRLSPGTSYTSSLVEYALPGGVCWRILWPLTLKTWLWLSDKCLSFKIGYSMTIKIIFFTALYIQYIYMQIHVITVMTIAIIVVKFSIRISVLLSFIYTYTILYNTILSYYVWLFILVYKVIYWWSVLLVNTSMFGKWSSWAPNSRRSRQHDGTWCHEKNGGLKGHWMGM